MGQQPNAVVDSLREGHSFRFDQALAPGFSNCHGDVTAPLPAPRRRRPMRSWLHYTGEAFSGIAVEQRAVGNKRERFPERFLRAIEAIHVLHSSEEWGVVCTLGKLLGRGSIMNDGVRRPGFTWVSRNRCAFSRGISRWPPYGSLRRNDASHSLRSLSAALYDALLQRG